MTFSLILLNSLSVMAISCMIIFAWQRRNNTGSKEIIIFSMFMLEWAIGSFLEDAVTRFQMKILMRDITQIGVFYTTAAVFMFSIAYTDFLSGYQKAIRRVIYTVQTCSIIFIMTDRWHHLARNNIYIEKNSLVVVTSIWDRILISFNFLYMAASIVMVASFAFITAKTMRKQVLCVVLGMLIIVSYSLVKVSTDGLFGINIPISGSFALGSAFILFGIIRYDLTMITPIARNEAINIMNDGIVIISKKGNIIDANPAALRIFNRTVEPVVGKHSLSLLQTTLIADYPEWYEAMLQRRTKHFDLSYELSNEIRYYFCENYPVRNKKNRIIGSFSVIKDITEQKKINNQLKLAAERDGLTGIYNRATFLTKAEECIRECKTEVCMYFIDIDYFKNINDCYGHEAGDYILVELCNYIEEKLPEEALFGRMGGEEFAVLYITDDHQRLLPIAENIRRGIENRQFRYKENEIEVTISMGIAYGSNIDFRSLYSIADSNLYKAKLSGRNRVCSVNSVIIKEEKHYAFRDEKTPFHV